MFNLFGNKSQLDAAILQGPLINVTIQETLDSELKTQA